jgi:16S rRNA (cytosine1402-N4)-methyltransferase
MSGAFHVPVLADAVLGLFAGRHRVVDATVGGGGHSAAFLAGGASVLAIDQDPDALAAARTRLGAHHIEYLQGNFGASGVLTMIAAFAPDFILLDLGVSSHQLDADERGFSYRVGVPLDMRMSRTGPTAAAVLNAWSEQALRELFRAAADERRAARLAGAIVERRARGGFATSDDFVGAIRRALGPRSGPADFARLFQAVRIAVNDELAVLERTLPVLRRALVPGGVLAVISYHSGEDRLVKTAFRAWGADCRCPSGQPVCTCEGESLGRVVTRRPMRPTADECATNVRARSARLRAFEAHGGGA